MAENGNLYNHNNNLNNFNNIESTTREFINRTTTTTAATTTNSSLTILPASTTTSSSGIITTTPTTILDQGQCERDAIHYRLRHGIVEGFEYITCLSCGESFQSLSLLEIYDHFQERPHLRHYSNCLYCQGKVHQYYHNRQQQVKYYHNCLRWKRGEDH